ncbi:MAG: type II toxin-antitoxin system VapC family toxin [Rhodospirillaceae bacterium]|nr:type II toxin-antitoxin system VapC family toxin [Rhodospirillaceae bacterium]
MKLLLDSHILLWWLNDDRKLLKTEREAIANAGSVTHVSAATLWELSIKRASGRLRAPDNLEELVINSRLVPLPILLKHAEAAGRLPLKHTDPFDRMLIAQAQIEGLTIVTRDREIAKYDVAILKT